GVKIISGCRLDRPDVQNLPGEVPVIESLAGLDALIALETDQLSTADGRPSLGKGCLAGARFALEQQRPAHRSSQEEDGRQALAGKVPSAPQRITDRCWT